jgi:hypothetical protein
MRVLVVSYAFPPVGGAGVQRMLKLVKYLPEHGIQPCVLTVQNPSVPVSDDSLAREIPASVRVERTPTLEPGYAAKRAAWNARALGQRMGWRRFGSARFTPPAGSWCRTPGAGSPQRSWRSPDA